MTDFSDLLRTLNTADINMEEQPPMGVPGADSSETFPSLPTPDRIYSVILGEVETLFGKITEGNHESSQINAAKQQCHALLSGIQDKVNKRVTELERNAEWEEFTIAFYGETNAGKSTIIETLRIHLAETSKRDEQARFFKEMGKGGLSKADLENAQHALEQASQQLTTFESKFAAKNNVVKRELDDLEHALEVQRQRVASIKAAVPWWKKLIFLIQTPKEESDARQMAVHLQSRREQARQAFEPLARQHRALKSSKEAAQRALAELTRKLDGLAQVADGRIIGDGQSDFTRETRAYHFDTGQGTFALLDVPGIEGKEQAVIDEILKAVQKAHAVFYVTGKAAPPQTGSNGQAGTLEKIKAHLNDQTEVWTVFNKRITNPMQLNGKMVSEDERTSLDTLDAEMRKQLGNNYAGTLTIAARPAFLAVAQCLIPFGAEEKNREKFAAKFSAEDLIERSGLAALSQKLGVEILAGFPAKIRQANFTKANTVLEEAIQTINEARETVIAPLIDSLRETQDAASTQLVGALEELKADFAAETDTQIETFKRSVREEIYQRIDDDLSKEEFKYELELVLEDELPELNAGITRSAEAVFDKFEQSARRALEDYQRQTADLQKLHSRFAGNRLHSGFDLNINIDDGVNVTGLLSALIGGALLWWNPAGWLSLLAGGAALITGLLKSIWSFFDDDYKKAQQRKAADENIRDIGRKVVSSTGEVVEEAIDKIRGHLEETEASLKEPAHAMSLVSAALGDSVNSLAALSNAVRTQATT